MSSSPNSRVGRRAVLGASYAAPALLVLRPVAALAQSIGGNPIDPGPDTGNPGFPPAEEPEEEPPEEEEPDEEPDPGGPGPENPDPGDGEEEPPSTVVGGDTDTPPGDPEQPPGDRPPDQGKDTTTPLPSGTASAAQSDGLAMTGIDTLRFLGLSVGAVGAGAAMVRAARHRDGVSSEEGDTEVPDLDDNTPSDDLPS